MSRLKNLHDKKEILTQQWSIIKSSTYIMVKLIQMIKDFTRCAGNDQTMLRLCDHHKRRAEVVPTHVITSFRDSIAFSSVILSGLSSDVCFFMSAALKEKKKGKFVERQKGRKRWKSCGQRWEEKNREEKKLQTVSTGDNEGGRQVLKETDKEKRQGGM